MKSHESTNQNLKLITIDYKKPNYEALKQELNYKENAVPRLKALEKEPRHMGFKECSFGCGEQVETWIYEDEETNRTFGKGCVNCTGLHFGSEKINKEPQTLMHANNNDWYSESKPVKILSWGGGMDSTILILKYGMEVDEIILSDTGAEEIETYEYIKYFISQLPWWIRDKITILHNDHEGDIDTWHFDQKLIPMPFTNRTCTDKFKLRVIHRYLRRIYGTKAVFDMMVGINYDEQIERERPLATDSQLEHHIEHVLKYDSEALQKYAHRQKISVEDYKERLRNALQTGSFDKKGIFHAGHQYARNVYPLIEDKIRRDDEKTIYEEHGLQVPPKSGCYFCPMKSKAEFERLEKEHPDQYENVKRLDENSKSVTVSILTMKEKQGDKMRCSCSNGIYEEDEDSKKYEKELAGKGF